MADKIIENNQVSIMGKIDTGFTFSHQVFGEGFYTMELLVRRIIRGSILRSMDNSGLITDMKRNITVWFFLFLRGK